MKWSNKEKLNRYILRNRACDCKDCGPIEAPLPIELSGIVLLAFVSNMVFCKRGSLFYYIMFWILWEAGIYTGGKFNLCSTNINYKRRVLIILSSIIAWLISREIFCPK